MLHVYYGADEYRLSEALRDLRAGLDTDGLLGTNTTVLAARGLTPGVLLQHVSTLPFLAAARLVIIEGLIAATSGRDGLRTWTPVLEALPALPPSNHLVLVDVSAGRDTGGRESSPGRSAFLKALREVPGADVREFRPLRATGRDNEVATWVRGRAQATGVAIEPAAVAALVEHVGADLRVLAGELEKLARYAGPRTITRADVDALTPEAHETNVFSLVDAVVEGRQGQAVVLLRAQIAEGNDEPLRVQALLARQVRNLVRAREVLDGGGGPADIAEATGVTGDYPLRKLVTQARAVPIEAAEAALRAIEDCDHSIKTGALGDELALELLVIRLGELLAARPAGGPRSR